MRAASFLLALVVALLGAAPAGLAQEVDPTGDYSFTLTDMKVAGDCPMGPKNSGTLSILKEGGGYLLTYIKGMECRPPSVCVLKGTCKGPECIFSTTVKVDSEGGTVTNWARLRFRDGKATGPGKSVYSHPSGFRCTWNYVVTMTK